MSADDWRLALNAARQASKGGMLWPANPNTKDSGARSSNWTRPRQSIGTSLSNIAGNIKRGTEHTLELVDGATSLAASGIGAAATVAQTGAAGAHAVADVTNMIGDILGGAPRPRRHRQRAIRGGGGGGGGGGSEGSDSPPLAIEDANYSSSSTDTQGPLAIVDRPQFLALEDGSMGPQARRRRRTQAQILDATTREWLGRPAQGSSVLEATPRTRGWSHRGPN